MAALRHLIAHGADVLGVAVDLHGDTGLLFRRRGDLRGSRDRQGAQDQGDLLRGRRHGEIQPRPAQAPGRGPAARDPEAP